MSQTPSSQGGPPRPRSSFRHIMLPMLAALLIVGAAFALIVLSGPAGISSAADAGLVVLGLLLLPLCLIPVGLAFASIFGVNWLLRSLPNYTRIARDFSARVAQIVERVAKQVSNVIISAMTGLSMARWFMGDDKSDDNDSPPA